MSLNESVPAIGTSVNAPIDNRSRVEFRERGREDPRIKCRGEGLFAIIKPRFHIERYSNTL